MRSGPRTWHEVRAKDLAQGSGAAGIVLHHWHSRQKRKGIGEGGRDLRVWGA